MAATATFRQLARERFPGFNITGEGEWAVPYTGSTLLVELFAEELLARFRAMETGAKVFQLKPPAPRVFRPIRYRDDD
jgi:hypothetical protein